MSRAPDEPDRLPGVPRPRETAALFGQRPAEAQVLAALASRRPHHGWLLTGPPGVGKATLAWRIARHLLAGAPGGTLDMPPDAPTFRRAAALAAPELFLCRRPWDAKAERLRTAITVDEVRALKAHFQLSAPDGGWRVAIVDAADELTDAAANALLKVLEEPPARAAILLVCHQPARLMPTIRSRCRTLRLDPLAPDDLARALAAAGAPPAADADATLAALAGGSVGAALRLAAGDGVALYRELADLLAAAPPIDRRRATKLAEACAGRDAAARYHLALELIRLAVARLARHGAGGGPAPAFAAEAAAMARLAPGPGQARLWAETAAMLGERIEHARGVHLDPAQVILDTLLRIDAAAQRALLLAA